MIDDLLIQELMRAVRVKSKVGADELKELSEACRADLEIAGVYVMDFDDPLPRQALKLYCKANYGYDKDSEKFRDAYAALKDSMALSGEYGK